VPKLSLEEVSKAQVKKLLSDPLKIRAPKTVEVTHVVISGIFSEANELGYTEVNPAHGLLKRVLPAKKKRILSAPDPFPRQDMKAFLDAAWAKLPQPLSLILEVMAMAGLRLGETLLRVRNPHDLKHTYATTLLMDH